METNEQKVRAALEQRPRKRLAAIARELGISRQRVSQIADKLKGRCQTCGQKLRSG